MSGVVSASRWIALVALLGCSALADYDRDEDARQKLLEMYPPGTLSRAEVDAREGNAGNQPLWERPANGWTDDSVLGRWCLRSESRTGKSVARASRHLHPRGVFGLSYWWFFYDADDRLIDVDWQWASD